MVSGSVSELAAVSTEKKAQDMEKVKGQQMAQLIDSAGPQIRAPRDGSTFSIYA